MPIPQQYINGFKTKHGITFTRVGNKYSGTTPTKNGLQDQLYIYDSSHSTMIPQRDPNGKYIHIYFGQPSKVNTRIVKQNVQPDKNQDTTVKQNAQSDKNQTTTPQVKRRIVNKQSWSGPMFTGANIGADYNTIYNAYKTGDFSGLSAIDKQYLNTTNAQGKTWADYYNDAWKKRSGAQYIPQSIQQQVTENINPQTEEKINPIINQTFSYTQPESITKLMNSIGIHKQGGKMINKYQQGGVSPQEDNGGIEQQVAQLIAAAQQGDQQATQQIQQIMQAAKQGDPKAQQLAQIIQSVMQQMQGQAQMARMGAKLNYIKYLKGECPEGTELKYFKAGGQICKVCAKKIQQDKCGKKIKKNCSGGVSKAVNGIKADMKKSKTVAPKQNKPVNPNDTVHIQNKPYSLTPTEKRYPQLTKQQYRNLPLSKKGEIDEKDDMRSHAKGGNLHTAFGSKIKDPEGHKSTGTNRTAKDSPNKFTSFGDNGKKKPTNVGLVGHKATGKTGLLRTKESNANNKHTAFGSKVNKSHRGAKASTVGKIGSVGKYTKGNGGTSGITKIHRYGGILTTVTVNNALNKLVRG